MSDVKIESGTAEMVAFKLYENLVVHLDLNDVGEKTINNCLELYTECLKTVQDHKQKGDKFKISE